MKIVSFHYPRNYGAFLQAFAMQNVVSCAEHVNFIPGIELSVGDAGRKKMPFFWRFVAFFRWLKKDHLFFPEMNELRKTKLCKSVKDVKKLEMPCDEILVAGSDQIWNPDFISMQEDVYFLNFGEKSCRRIAYAASLGVKSWPKSFESKVLPFLKRFYAISVREESSVDYLKSIGLTNVSCVCDPTILHDADFYRKRFRLRKGNETKPFVYRIREEIPENLWSFLSKSVIVDLRQKKELPSVSCWLSFIENASFVITDSFHCAVFCILFHKNFLVIPNTSKKKGMNERFLTLLKKMDLEYRSLTINETTQEISDKLNMIVNWDEVEIKLNLWRTESMKWLNDVMKNNEISN